MNDHFAQDILARSRWAFDHNAGHPKPAWSTGEKLAVALVLDDEHTFAEWSRPGRDLPTWRDFVAWYKHARADAAQRVYGGMINPPGDFTAWLNDIRAALDRGQCEGCHEEPAIRRYRAMLLGADCVMTYRHLDDYSSRGRR